MKELENVMRFILTREEMAALEAACTSTLLTLMVSVSKDPAAGEIAGHLSSAVKKVIELQEDLLEGVKREEGRAH